MADGDGTGREHDTKGAADSEDRLEQFERAWHEGRRPVLDDFLAEDGGADPLLLVELVHADLECRLKAGLSARVEDYLARYPRLGDDAGALLDLVAHEYDLRRRGEPGPAIGAYLARFPQLGEALAGRLRALPPPPAPKPLAGLPTVAAFVRALRETELLSPSLLEEVVLLAAAAADPKALARELLRRNWLTAFQVNQVLQGRAAGLVLGSYLLLERLSAGGMGRVFKARHRMMNRTVAVKLIHPEHVGSAEAAARFRREILAAARLSHPNIVILHDATQAGDTPFLVMEYVEGIDLDRLVREQGPRPVAAACEMARQAALGLQHAHERGLVHRDVKPANLLLAKDGTVKVFDFGLARFSHLAIDDQTLAQLTRQGAVIGTVDFMAPEQAADARAVDVRADVYGLGATLYFVLTGKPPFPGGAMGRKLRRIEREEPQRVEALRPEVPPALADVVRRMMAKEVEDRYQTPAEVAAALAPFCGVERPVAIPLQPK
jgi:hypothetical protein